MENISDSYLLDVHLSCLKAPYLKKLYSQYLLKWVNRVVFNKWE